MLICICMSERIEIFFAVQESLGHVDMHLYVKENRNIPCGSRVARALISICM